MEVCYMTNNRIAEILRSKQLNEIYYNEQPVWIQEVHGDKASIGFLNSDASQDVYIKDLYENQ